MEDIEMRKIFLILFLSYVFCQSVEAQKTQQQEIIQFLPHFVAGRLPASEWGTTITVSSLTYAEVWVRLEFFNTIGQPIVLATDRGTDKEFLMKLKAGETVIAETIEILQSNGFVTGWIKVTSTWPVSVYLKFQQFNLGKNSPIGQASVFASPSELVLTFPLDPENGVALVNPSTADANVKFVALDKAGNKIKEGAFPEPLRKGHHLAKFFREEPFFLNGVGEIVIFSNVPLSGIALDFDGGVFSTLPSLPPKRRLDVPAANSKIGSFYVYSDDREPVKQVAEKLNEAYFLFEDMMRRELRLNGTMSNIPELPIDRDESGLTKTLIVKLQKPREFYVRNGFTDVNIILREIKDRELLPLDWGFLVMYSDLWKVVGNKVEASNQFGGHGLAFLSALNLPYLSSVYFGDKRKHNNRFLDGNTNEEAAEGAFGVFSHELGHAMGLPFHDTLSFNHSPNKNFTTIMSGSYDLGCYNPTNPERQCVLSPMEAHGIARSPILNTHKYGWIKEDKELPKIEVLSKEWAKNRMRVVVRIEDNNSGVYSVILEWRFKFAPDNNFSFFWKFLGHQDNLEEFIIETALPDWMEKDFKKEDFEIFVEVIDYHNNSEGSIIF